MVEWITIQSTDIFTYAVDHKEVSKLNTNDYYYQKTLLFYISLQPQIVLNKKSMFSIFEVSPQ